jgi:F-type H+-transporting ATPase subunit b
MFDATMWAQIWAQVALVLFIGLIIYLGVPRMITKSLDERAAKIASELDAAKRLRDEAQALLAEYPK